MSIAVTCPQCQAKYSVAAERLAPKMKCAKCGAAIETATAAATAASTPKSAAKSAAAATADPMFLEEIDRALSAGSMRPPVPVHLQRNVSGGDGDFLSKPLFWISGGLVILVLFVGIGSYVLFRPASNEDAYSLSLKKQKKKPGVVLVGQAEADEPAAEEETVKLPPPSAPVPKATASSIAPAPTTGAKPSGTADPNTPRVKLAVADLIESVRDGVVHITVKDEEGEAFATGSGFVIGRFKDRKWEWSKSEKKDEKAKKDKGDEAEEEKERQPIEGDVWLVATNHHVVAGSSGATVRMHDGKTYESLGMIAHDAKRDLVILVLDKAPEVLRILPFADAKAARQGEDVVAIGHPIGFDFTVSTGIISAVRGTKDLPEEVAEWIDAPADQKWLQTTAAISSGNSGGPLLTMYGEVIGVNTWGMTIGDSLAFASHSQHLRDMLDKAYDPNAAGSNMTLWHFSAAQPTESEYKIGEDDEWLETEVREELTRTTERATAIDWRPGSRGDYVTFQQAAHMLTLCEIFRYKTNEKQKIATALKKKKWDYEREVAAINRYAILSLEQEKWPMFLLGTVRRVNKLNSRHFWVDLAGRGFVVAVTLPKTSEAPKLAVGDEVAVFGYCVGYANETPTFPRKVHHVLAGLIASVKLPDLPKDTWLLAAYDLAKTDRADQGFGDHVRKFVDDYARIQPMIGKTAVRWSRFELNARGRQFDAVRFTVPEELHSDIVWCFNDPADVIESWGIMAVSNFAVPQEAHHADLRGIVAPGLTREESSRIVVQGLGHGLLVPGEDYILWLMFRDTNPRRMAIAARLVPVGSFDPTVSESIGGAIREGTAFKPDVLARVTKAQKLTPSASPTATATPTANPMPPNPPETKSGTER